MTKIQPNDVESLESFQNLDDCEDWLSHDPTFEWSEDDLAEFAHEEAYRKQEQEAMAAWWDMEGVRCATFGRDPNKNPYRE
jgi:hypothetical protein